MTEKKILEETNTSIYIDNKCTISRDKDFIKQILYTANKTGYLEIVIKLLKHIELITFFTTIPFVIYFICITFGQLPKQSQDYVKISYIPIFSVL